ncbi:MAG: molybdopterin cofactor-binding domain-containing protein, partial [Dehalobacterium sp.]
GEESVHGWKIGSCGLPECIAEAKELSHWDEKRKKDNFSKSQRLRGIGLACCNHVSGYRPILKDFDGSSALVKVGPDGKAIVFSGEVDIGQGYRTIAAQCAAEELGIPLEYVEVADVDSQTSVLGIGSLASRGTVMGGNAVVRAAADAKEKILHGIEGLLNKASGTIKITEGKFVDQQGEILGTFSEMVRRLCNAHSGEPIMGSGYYYPDTVIPDPITKFGNTSPAYPFGAHVAEVEIDMETGKVTVVNYAAVNDVGKVINPMMAVGQLAGGVLQGIGWVLSENLVVLQGKIVNPNLLDYKIPTMADMVETNTGLVEAPDDNGPYGAKSLGEAALDPVAAAVCNAISHALGTRITKIPVLEEDILAIIKKKYGTQGGEGCGCT